MQLEKQTFSSHEATPKKQMQSMDSRDNMNQFLGLKQGKTQISQHLSHHSDDLECVINESGNNSNASKKSKIQNVALQAIKKSRAKPIVQKMTKQFKENGVIDGFNEELLNKYMSGDLEENDFLPYPANQNRKKQSTNVREITESSSVDNKGAFKNLRPQKLVNIEIGVALNQKINKRGSAQYTGNNSKEEINLNLKGLETLRNSTIAADATTATASREVRKTETASIDTRGSLADARQKKQTLGLMGVGPTERTSVGKQHIGKMVPMSRHTPVTQSLISNSVCWPNTCMNSRGIPKIKFGEHKMNLIKDSIANTLSKASSPKSWTARGGQRSFITQTAKNNAKFNIDKTEFPEIKSPTTSNVSHIIQSVGQKIKSPDTSKMIMYNPLSARTGEPLNLRKSNIKDIAQRKFGSMQSPPKLIQQIRTGDNNGSMSHFYKQDKIKYVSEAQVMGGIKSFQVLVDDEQMKEIDAEIAKKEIEAEMKKSPKQRITEKMDAHLKRDEELMPRFPAANMIGKLDKYQELGFEKGSKEEFQAKEQMKRLDLLECEVVANLYTQHFVPWEKADEYQKKEQERLAELDLRDSLAVNETIVQEEPSEEEDTEAKDIHALALKKQQEIKYIQYLPADMGQPGVNLELAVKNLYKTRPTHVSQDPNKRRIDPEKKRKGFIYQNHGKECMEHHTHSKSCSKQKDVDLAQLQSLQFKFMCLQKPEIESGTIPSNKRDRSDDNRASFFPSSTIPFELVNLTDQKKGINKITNLSDGKLRSIFLKKISQYLQGVGPRDYDFILPGEREQLAYAIESLQENDGYEIQESIDLKDSSKTEIQLSNLLNSIESRERSINTLKIKKLSKTGGFRKFTDRESVATSTVPPLNFNRLPGSPVTNQYADSNLGFPRMDTFSPLTPSSEGVFYETNQSGFTKLGQIYNQNDPKEQSGQRLTYQTQIVEEPVPASVRRSSQTLPTESKVSMNKGASMVESIRQNYSINQSQVNMIPEMNDETNTLTIDLNQAAPDRDQLLKMMSQEQALLEQHIQIQKLFESYMSETQLIKDEILERQSMGAKIHLQQWKSPYSHHQETKKEMTNLVNQRKTVNLEKQVVSPSEKKPFRLWKLTDLKRRANQIKKIAQELQEKRLDLLQQVHKIHFQSSHNQSFQDSEQSMLEQSIQLNLSNNSPLKLKYNQNIYPNDQPLLNLQDAFAVETKAAQKSSQNLQYELNEITEMIETTNRLRGSQVGAISHASEAFKMENLKLSNNSIRGPIGASNQDTRGLFQKPSGQNDSLGQKSSGEDNTTKKSQRIAVDLQRSHQNYSLFKEIQKEIVDDQQIYEQQESPRSLISPNMPDAEGEEAVLQITQGSHQKTLNDASQEANEAIMGTIYGGSQAPNDLQHLNVVHNVRTADGSIRNRPHRVYKVTPRKTASNRGKQVETYLDQKDCLGNEDMLSGSFEQARDILSSNKKKKKGPTFLERYRESLKNQLSLKKRQKRKPAVAIPVVSMQAGASVGDSLEVSLIPKGKSSDVTENKIDLVVQQQMSSTINPVQTRMGNHPMTPEVNSKLSETFCSDLRKQSQPNVVEEKIATLSTPIASQVNNRGNQRLDSLPGERDSIGAGDQSKTKGGRKLNIVIHTTNKDPTNSKKKSKRQPFGVGPYNQDLARTLPGPSGDNRDVFTTPLGFDRSEISKDKNNISNVPSRHTQGISLGSEWKEFTRVAVKQKQYKLGQEDNRNNQKKGQIQKGLTLKKTI